MDVESPVMTTDTTELMSDSRKQEPTKASREKKKKSSAWCWCCSLAFVAQYFDVDTSDVKNRIQNVIMPCPSKKFLNLTHGNPDFYGPFWIATTLIFVIGVTANINEYSSSDDKQWYVFLCVCFRCCHFNIFLFAFRHYDISKPSLAFSVVYAYVPLLGLCLWFTLKYLGTFFFLFVCSLYFSDSRMNFIKAFKSSLLKVVSCKIRLFHR